MTGINQACCESLILSYVLFFLLIDDDECIKGTASCSNGACVNSAYTYSCDCTGSGYEGADCSAGNIFYSRFDEGQNFNFVCRRSKNSMIDM